MKAPMLALITLGLVESVAANKYQDRLKEQEQKKVVPSQARHRLGANYDDQFCVFERINSMTGVINQACFDHQTDVRIGWELDQSSDEDDDITYWTLRFMPYAQSEIDWRPFLNLNRNDFKFYSQTQFTFDEFKVGAFGEVTFWWDWSSAGSDTRKLCYGAGRNFDTITFKTMHQTYINDCYKTIISNILEPAAPFNDPNEPFGEWSYCNESDQIEAPIFEYNWYEESEDQENYFVGEEAAYDATEGCTSAFFAPNTIQAHMFDLFVSTFYPGKGKRSMGPGTKKNRK